MNVCVGLYLYNEYLNVLQLMCDMGRDQYCDDYEPPPPPPPSPSSSSPSPSSSGGGPSFGDLWDMANDKEGAKVLWVVFTHIALTVFRPTASFMLCCCKDPPAGAAAQRPQVPVQPVANPLANKV